MRAKSSDRVPCESGWELMGAKSTDRVLCESGWELMRANSCDRVLCENGLDWVDEDSDQLSPSFDRVVDSSSES